MTDSPAFAALGLPTLPSPALDPYLDAAARCFVRHGLRRTRVTDIADEVGVSRVTVYRQVGTVEDAARLLLARELDRLVTALVPKLLAADDADGIVSVIASAVEFATTHPVLSKVLHDEPELVGGFVIAELPTLIDRLLVLAEPVVRRLADLDERARFDIPVLGEWVARVVITMVVAPPKEAPEEFLRKVLLPVLGS
ncbi:MAG: TetR/AcrR family transcriptional regulator [Acidimicrobiia bacterium]